MHFHDVALVAIAFFSEVLGTLSGFGSSTFFVPFAFLVESFQFVLALTAILHCFGNFFKIVLFRKDFQWKIFLRLALPSVIFTGFGALLTTQISVRWIVLSLGIVLILLSALSLLRPLWRWSFPKWAADVLVVISGFSTGFVGTGGALRGLALTTLQLPKNTFVGVSSAIDLGGDLLRASIYLKNGFMDWGQWFYLPLLALAAFAGARVGKVLLSKINQAQFEKIVAVFVLFSGILMIFES